MFNNETTAAQFEPVPGFEQDRIVNLIGRFSKNVSDLLPEEARALIDNGVNYIRPRAQASVPDAVAEAATELPAAVEKKSLLVENNE